MVRDLLGKISITENGKADKDVLMEFIDTITVEKGNVFKWGLWLRNKPSYLRMTTSGRGDNMTASAVGAEFDAKECSDTPKTGQNGHFTPAGCDHHRLLLNKARRTKSKPFWSFSISFEQAKQYLRKYLNVLTRKSQFEPIIVDVYL